MSASDVAFERFNISLNVFHPQYSYQDIEVSLGLLSRIGQTVGLPRTTPRGDPLEGVYSKTRACFDLVDSAPGHVLDGVREVLSDLQRHKAYFRSVTNDGGRVQLYIGVFFETTSSIVFDLGLLSEINEMSMNLSIHCYGGP